MSLCIIHRKTWTGEVNIQNSEECEQMPLTPTEMYETIPALTRNTAMDDEENKYSVLEREQSTIPEILGVIGEENKESYSKLEVNKIDSSDIKTENNPAYCSTSKNS